MQRFNFPTTILFGEGALAACAQSIKEDGAKKVLLVTDNTLIQLGTAKYVEDVLIGAGLAVTQFADLHPNPTEADVELGAKEYLKHQCDALVGLGGGSPIDTAKVIAVAATHTRPLAQYDDAKGGDELINGSLLPSIYAIPTTAGTGSEVGRSGVIITRESNNKTVIFHPQLMPKIAALEPKLTEGLPPAITAATGIDAFVHCLEAYLAPGFHPMADGIALEGVALILEHLPRAVANGHDLEARGAMQIAASMGATAFQKGLGMIHSLAHPLSSECGMHHGLANALLLPFGIDFLERSDLNAEQKKRINKVQQLFSDSAESSLADLCRHFVTQLNIQLGLKQQSVNQRQLMLLSKKAYLDPCHQTNMIPVTEADLLQVYTQAY
ncbi:iron-containing alcohol dehydrogenase [Pseudomonadota bacterium]